MGRYGISTQGDVLVHQSSDGVPLDQIWGQIRAALEAWSSHRSTIASLLSYKTTNVADALPQGFGGASFEEASEFGVPKSVRAGTALPLGYSFNDYDLRESFTWKFLRDSTAEQIKASANEALAADNQLVTTSILKRVFDPAEGLSPEGHRIFGLWSGDGIVPPPFAGQEFSGSTTHYLVSGSADLDLNDIEQMISIVTGKGYGVSSSSKLILLAHPSVGAVIQSWRAGETNANSQKAKYSFIPSANAPAYIQEGTLVGNRAPADYNGVPVAGSYGPAWLVESRFVPVGYVTAFATSGLDSPGNVVAIREHPTAAYRNLRLIPGNGKYPLSESFFQRSFGVGVRHRGAAVVAQIKASGNYEPPSFDLLGL